MAKTDQLAAIIFGAAAGLALVRFFNMPKEKRESLCNHLKDQTNYLLDNAEDTVEKVEHYMDEYRAKDENAWIDKLYVLKKMFKNLYGNEKRFFL
ncbi:MAG TPA: hypothetical protein VIJ95_09890 [Hanamia sp.]